MNELNLSPEQFIGSLSDFQNQFRVLQMNAKHTPIDRIISSLEQMVPIPQQLSVYCLAASKKLQQTADAEKEELEKLTYETNKLYSEIEALKRAMKDKKAEVTGGQVKKQLLDKELKRCERSIAELNSKVKATEKRCKELKKWCWVPGYGQYLAIRTLAKQDIQTLQNAGQRYSTLLCQQHNTVRSLNATVSQLNQLQRDIASMNSTGAAKEKEKDYKYRLMTYYKQQTVTYVNASKAFGELSAQMNVLYTALKTEKGLLEIDSRTELFVDADALMEIKSLYTLTVSLSQTFAEKVENIKNTIITEV